jgi:hypothetical protein
MYVCRSLHSGKNGVSERSMKEFNDAQLHNYVSPLYYHNDHMNGDERVGYTARARQTCVQSFSKET